MEETNEFKKEIIVIENFGGIKYIEFELNKINLIIGPQASGKSITAKLLYFFKNVFKRALLAAENQESKLDFDKSLIEKFEDYFPPNTWPMKSFEITYSIGEFTIKIQRSTKGSLKITYDDFLKEELGRFRKMHQKISDTYRDRENLILFNNSFFEILTKYDYTLRNKIGTQALWRQYFIPAGRSFFANLQTGIFSFLSTNKAIDPFLIEFGSFYENMKFLTQRRIGKKKDISQVERIVDEVLRGKYQHEKGTDFLVHNDNRKINVAYSSSGQQETLPLVLILSAMDQFRFDGSGATLYIEEPEAHLFPKAQKSIVELIATVFNSNSENFQFIITTHSPYILAAFNNLIHGAEIYHDEPSKRESLEKILSKDKLIKSEFLNAVSFKDGELSDIKCPETNLISQTILDSVSEEIAIQFDDLLEL